MSGIESPNPDKNNSTPHPRDNEHHSHPTVPPSTIKSSEYSSSFKCRVPLSRNKPRLALALYYRPKHLGTYHYALVLVPKPSPSSDSRSVPKFHVKNTIFRDDTKGGVVSHDWRFEKDAVDARTESRLLVLVIIGKVSCSLEVLERILRSVPLIQKGEEGGDKFDCVSWVRDAFEKVRKERFLAKGKSDDLKWDELKAEVEGFAVRMMEEKVRDIGVQTPCLDILEGKSVALN